MSRLPPRTELIEDLQGLALLAVQAGDLDTAAKFYDLIAKICGYVGAGAAKPVQPVDAQTALRLVTPGGK